MPVKLRLATFNVENMFTRHNFEAFLQGPHSRSANYLSPYVKFMADYGDGDLTKFAAFQKLVEMADVAQEDDKRQQTAQALAATRADVVAFQEVDSHQALQRFLKAYYAKQNQQSYRHVALHEGNDRRGIDVAVAAQADWPFYTRSHASLTGAWIDNEPSGEALLRAYPEAAKLAGKLNNQRIFRRDCLEVVLTKAPVTVFNCHFKSMGGGRSDSMAMRQLEALTVREIINRKFEDPASALWAVVGDLNDYQQVIKVSARVDDDGNPVEVVQHMQTSGVDPLLKDGFGVNLLNSLPEAERWTHFYPAQKHKTQLDYIIASPALAAKMIGTPEVIRAGMPYRVPNTDDIARFPRVGWDRPKASDHCPVVVEFRI